MIRVIIKATILSAFLFNQTFLLAQPAGPSPIGSSAPVENTLIAATVARPTGPRVAKTLPITQAEFKDIVRSANADLLQWFTERSKDLPKSVKRIYGPSVDGTYFYRLGVDGVAGDPTGLQLERSFGSRITEIKKQLVAQGFPERMPSEMLLVGVTNNIARATAKPDVQRCMKHFPGGDEMIEVTESYTSFMYVDTKSIQRQLIPFKLILGSKKAPDCIMINHARYMPEAFGKKEKQNLGPLIGDFNFSELPASFNPGIIDYLRKDLGFKGIIIADWYNMGATTMFIKSYIAHKVADIHRNTMIFYLATHAGIDIVPIRMDVQKLYKSLARLPIEIQQQWAERIAPDTHAYLKKLGIHSSLEKILEMPLIDQLAIRGTELVDREPILDKHFSAAEMKKLAPYAEDPWTRSGVLTLAQRQFIVQKIAKKLGQGNMKLPKLPYLVEDENDWFEDLRDNAAFQKIYKDISWESPVVQNTFAEIAVELAD